MSLCSRLYDYTEPVRNYVSWSFSPLVNPTLPCCYSEPPALEGDALLQELEAIWEYRHIRDDFRAHGHAMPAGAVPLWNDKAQEQADRRHHLAFCNQQGENFRKLASRIVIVMAFSSFTALACKILSIGKSVALAPLLFKATLLFGTPVLAFVFVILFIIKTNKY